MAKYEFINEALFFSERGILAIGDLHIGYEHMLQQSGILIPDRQVSDIIDDLKKIIEKIKSMDYKLRKVIFMGDIKHFFSYQWKERINFDKVVEFLTEFVDKNDIIFIRGNHDTIDLRPDFRDYHIEDDVFFTHGHQSFSEMFDKKIKFIVTGHLHPSVLIRDKEGVKAEAYKCFLEGKYEGKNLIVLPSFLGFAEGTFVNEYGENYIESFFIVPKKDILNFKVHAIGEDGIYDFGTIKDLQF